MKVNLTQALKQFFGFSQFKGDQERIIQIYWMATIPLC